MIQDYEQTDKPDPPRCVIVVNRDLAPGRAANAAAVVALTLGQRHPQLVGPPLVDADRESHPGLIPIGIAVLGASESALSKLRASAKHPEIDVVDFPVQGQRTNDYANFVRMVAEVPLAELKYLAIGLVGPKKRVSKLVGGLSLLT